MYIYLGKLLITTSANRPQLWNNNLTWWYFFVVYPDRLGCEIPMISATGCNNTRHCLRACRLPETNSSLVKMEGGRLVSFWETLFSGVVWNFWGVTRSNQKNKGQVLPGLGQKSFAAVWAKKRQGTLPMTNAHPKAQCFQRKMDTDEIEIVHFMPLHKWFDPYKDFTFPK